MKPVEEPEGVIQYLLVENTGGVTLESCYASATLGEGFGFNLLWPLSTYQPRLQRDKVAFVEAEESTNLVPNVPRVVSLLVAAHQTTGETAFTFGSRLLSIEQLRSFQQLELTQLELKVRFAGRNYQDPTIHKYKLDLKAPWNEMRFIEIS